MILVTGGTGFLGTQLVRQLVDRGDKVRVLCRRPLQQEDSYSKQIDVTIGDITQPETLDRAFDGIRRVYHVAGKVDFNPPDDRDLLRVNEQGTRHLLQAAQKANVERVVHVSSVSTIGAARSPESPLCERDFGQGEGIDVPYPKSKLAGERVALEFAKAGLDVVIVNPTFFAGPEDWNLSSARTVLSFLKRQVWVGLNRGGMGFTDVRDVARGMILAMDKGVAGERYILGGTNLLLPEYHRLLQEVTGIRAPRILLPPRVAMAVAVIGLAGYKMFRIPTYVGVGDIRLAKHYWFYDYTKAQRDLGLTCRPPIETIRETVDWLKSLSL